MRNEEKCSRRNFMKKSAGLAGAAIAAPWIVPSSALGADGHVAPSNRIGIGMIAMGRQANYANVPSFLNYPDSVVLAVCDPDRWRLENARKKVEDHYAEATRSGKYKGCQVTTDFREVLDNPDIDGVMISSPDHWHAIHTTAAIRAGKDVDVEKPITMTIEEGREISDLCRKYGRVFRTDTNCRNSRPYHRACLLARNGYLGEIKTIRTGVPRGDIACDPQPPMPIPDELDYEMWLGPAPDKPYTQKKVHTPHSYARPGWMRVRDHCDGMITNWGTHMNDAAMWASKNEYTGPVEVQGTGVYPDDGLWGVLLDFKARFKFASGLDWYYEMSSPYMRLEGTEGWVHVNGGLQAEPKSLLRVDWKPEDEYVPPTHDKHNFVDCIKSRAHTYIPAEVGHRVTSLCHLAHIAVQRNGKLLKWDPDAEVFTNDDEANRMRTKYYKSPWRL